MSRAKTSENIEPTDEGRGIDWLERNATLLKISDRKDTESWQRAGEQRRDADIKRLSEDDLFRVELPDGEKAHLVLLVKNTDGDHVGACSCDGYVYNQYCAHLLVLAMMDVTEQYLRIQDMRAASLESDEVDAEMIDHSDQEDVLDVDQPDGADRDGRGTDHAGEGSNPTPVNPDEVVPVESSTKDTVEPQGTDTENRPASPSTDGKTDSTALAKGEDPFAGELPNVDDQYVMNLGGDTYIRRAGYARIAKSCGYRLDDLDEVVGAHETDWKHSKYRATIVDEDGNVVGEDVGSAHVDAEDLKDAHAHLDELAATRAVTRALGWATGEGLTAVAEVAEDRTERIE